MVIFKLINTSYTFQQLKKKNESMLYKNNKTSGSFQLIWHQLFSFINNIQIIKKKFFLSNIIKESVTIDCDVVLVEGFKHENYDKIIVYENEKQFSQS